MIANGHTMKHKEISWNLNTWNEKDWPDPLGQCTSATFWTIHSRATCQRSSWHTMTLLSQVQQMQPLTILTTQAEAVLRIKSFMNLCPQAHFKENDMRLPFSWAGTALQRCITKRRSRMQLGRIENQRILNLSKCPENEAQSAEAIALLVVHHFRWWCPQRNCILLRSDLMMLKTILKVYLYPI